VDPFSLIEQWWWAGLPAAVFVGVLLGASPLAWPLLAAAVGIGAGAAETDRRRGTWTLLSLGAGLTVVYASLGFVVGELDRIIREVLGAWTGWGYVTLAVVVGVAGVVMVARPAATCRVLARPPTGAPGAFLLGVPLGIINCPACAGVITGVAVSSGVLGSTAYSVAVMTALGVGHTVTLLVVSRLSATTMRPLLGSLGLQRLGGVLLLGVAGFFVFQASLGGLEVGTRLP
jgi:cytochrome c biogenesis protein CcdA